MFWSCFNLVFRTLFGLHFYLVLCLVSSLAIPDLELLDLELPDQGIEKDLQALIWPPDKDFNCNHAHHVLEPMEVLVLSLNLVLSVLFVVVVS